MAGTLNDRKANVACYERYEMCGAWLRATCAHCGVVMVMFALWCASNRVNICMASSVENGAKESEDEQKDTYSDILGRKITSM